MQDCEKAGRAYEKVLLKAKPQIEERLPPWEAMLKKMVWSQLDEYRGKRILDFGSGMGVSASYYAENNTVIAIEPNEELVNKRWNDYEYEQVLGGMEKLEQLKDNSFDVILCHSVLEYVEDRQNVVREFYRLLKPDGILSVVKHNPAGRVMQMTVLLNQFDRAERILNGQNDMSTEYGIIQYYDDKDVLAWCPEFTLVKTQGICTFWRLQQNQEMQSDVIWQRNMLKLEMLAADIDVYKAVSFFHHIQFHK